MATPNLQEAQGTFARDSVQTRKRSVTSGAQTLTAAQSGTLCLFNTAAGYTFTLPIITANTVGIWYDFLCTITNTSVVAKIITGQATDLIVGNVLSGVEATTPGANPGPKFFPFATDKVACNFGGTDTTSGGVVGTRVRLEATALLQWTISGNVVCAGTIVTPAATS